MEEDVFYIDDNGVARPERRTITRDGQDPRIEHLFWGFRNVIYNEVDPYLKGYLIGMSNEFARLVHDIEKSGRLCPCGDRIRGDCPGEWEPGCDLGSNPRFARGGKQLENR